MTDSSLDSQTDSTTGPIPPPLIGATPYVPTDGGLTWALNIERLAQPPEFTPAPVSDTTAATAFPDTSYSSLAAHRHEATQAAFDTPQHSGDFPSESRIYNQPIHESHSDPDSDTSSQSNDNQDQTPGDEPSDTSSSSPPLVGRIDVDQIISRLRLLTDLPPRGLALLGGIGAVTLGAGIVGGPFQSVGALLILTGVLVLYTAVTFVTDPQVSDSTVFDNPRHQQLYDRAVVVLFGLLLIVLGGDTLGPRLITPF